MKLVIPEGIAPQILLYDLNRVLFTILFYKTQNTFNLLKWQKSDLLITETLTSALAFLGKFMREQMIRMNIFSN